VKTLEVHNAERCNTNNLRDNRVVDPNPKKYKTWFSAVGKSPNCASFQYNKRFIKLEVEKDEFLEYKYIPLGCGNSLICEECGKISLYKKLSRTFSLTTALSIRFPESEIASIVFTVPHNHKIHNFPSRKYFDILFSHVHKILNTIFPDCPHLLVLHTWSSKDPNDKHIHIHSLIFGIRESGKLQHLFYPAHQINKLWQDALDYPYQTNIHIKYWHLKNRPKTSHALKYTLRSPIGDFVKKINSVLTIDYICNINLLVGFQRIRWFGWMCNTKMKKTLAQFGIIQKVTVPQIKYRFISIVNVAFTKNSDGYVTEDYEYIFDKDILSPYAIIKLYFYEVHAPPN